MFQYDWWSSWRIWLTKKKGSFVGEGSEKGQIPNIFNGQILDQNRQFLLASENMLLYGLGKSPAWLQEFLFPSCNFHRFASSILGKAANIYKHIPSKGWWFIVKHHRNSTSKFLTLPGYWNLISFLQPYLPRIHGLIWFPYNFSLHLSISSQQNTHQSLWALHLFGTLQLGRFEIREGLKRKCPTENPRAPLFCGKKVV